MSDNGERKVVTLNRGNNTTCTVDLFGGQVTSWTIEGQEQFFLAGNTVFDNKTPLRAGIPVIFPKFANWGEKPFHGFARISMWEVELSPQVASDGDVCAKLILKDSEYTRGLWDHEFRLIHEIILGANTLTTHTYVINPSLTDAFDFDLILHTYFKIPDISRIELVGLKGCSAADLTKNGQEFSETRDSITIRQQTGALFKNTTDLHLVSGMMSGKTLKLSKSNFPDTVLWNPWAEVSKTIPELKDDDYKHFVCIEAGHVAKPVHLGPLKTYKASQVLQIV